MPKNFRVWFRSLFRLYSMTGVFLRIPSRPRMHRVHLDDLQRDGDLLVVYDGVTLPHRCPVCNAPAVRTPAPPRPAATSGVARRRRRSSRSCRSASSAGCFCFGFTRAVRTQCTQTFVVAFSCKRRGVCPSCNGRHMARAARPPTGPSSCRPMTTGQSFKRHPDRDRHPRLGTCVARKAPKPRDRQSGSRSAPRRENRHRRG